MLEGETVPSPVSSLEIAIMTSDQGCIDNLTVKVAVSPAPGSVAADCANGKFVGIVIGGVIVCSLLISCCYSTINFRIINGCLTTSLPKSKR